jgi:DNA-binding LacI/PurR family transcriptional regulator
LAITIHDVAPRARVSVTTVSRALAEPQLVRETTRARVLAVAKQLAYHPNQAARSLITGKTGNIGIIVPDLDNPFYPSVLRGVQACAHHSEYAVLLADSGADPTTEQNLVHRMAKQVDGIILCAPFSSDKQLSRLAEATSVVLVNRRLPGIPGVLINTARGMTTVSVPMESAGRAAVNLLLGRKAGDSDMREKIDHFELDTEFIVRATTGPPADADQSIQRKRRELETRAGNDGVG